MEDEVCKQHNIFFSCLSKEYATSRGWYSTIRCTKPTAFYHVDKILPQIKAFVSKT